MSLIYFLVCVRKHKSNLPTNIRTTVGKKTQWYVEKCNLLSETTFLPYFMTAWCVSFTKVCIFLPMVFIRTSTFITTLCFYDFCKTVLVKKCTVTLPRCGLIFPFQMPYFLHWLFTSSTLLTQLKPLKPKNKLQKKSRALPSSSRRGLRAPDPANPSSEKMTSQPTFFCCMYFPKV